MRTYLASSERRGSKTSVDILHERDALEARLRAIAVALAAIQKQAEEAATDPERSSQALFRIARAIQEVRSLQKP